MTDAEIIKALECCAGDDGCDVCPMYKPSSECITELQGEVLGLINRQKSENEKLRKRVNFVEQANVQLREELKETTEKFNCQQYVYADLSDIIKEKNAEIEKLQSNNSSMQSTLAKMSMGVEQAKAEAIKEFAEAFKVKFAKERYRDNYVIDDEMLDNLVKEMVGELDV